MELEQLERKHDLKSNGEEAGLCWDNMLKDIQSEHDRKTERLEKEVREFIQMFVSLLNIEHKLEVLCNLIFMLDDEMERAILRV